MKLNQIEKEFLKDLIDLNNDHNSMEDIVFERVLNKREKSLDFNFHKK